MFEVESKFFDEHRDEWTKVALGKFVLIKANEAYGFYDTDEKAYEKGAELFGVDPFLIKQILPTDTIETSPAYCLGLIHAIL